MNEVTLTDEGFVEHRGHRVWWGAVGEEERPGRSPVIAVHGGPGICHDCLEPLAALADGRRVVFYDQYGCGRSDRAEDPSEYDIGLFVEELEVLRRQLCLMEVHLFAHSYGGPIALEYLVSEPRVGVRSLVLSNSFASVPQLAAGWARRLGDLSESARRALTSGGSLAEPKGYGAAIGEFIDRFVVPMPLPEPLVRSQMHSGVEVYARMHGSSWFQPDGLWSSWDVTDQLHRIDVPTLVVGGSRDQCVPELSEAIHAAIPGSRLTMMDTAHLPFFEKPEEYFAILGRFLTTAEAAPRWAMPAEGGPSSESPGVVG